MNTDVIKRLLSYLKPHRAALIGAFVAALCSVPIGLLAPVLIGNAVDIIAAEGGIDFSAIAIVLVQLGVTIAASSLLIWLMQVQTRKVSAKAAQDLRTAAFQRISTAPLSKIDTHRHGDIVSALVNDADAVSEGLLQAVSQLFPGVITILATIVIMCVLNVWIAMLVIFVTPLSIFFARYVGTRTSKYFFEQSSAQGKLSAYVNEMVGNRDVVQSLGYGEQSAEHFAKLSGDLYESNFKATLYSSIVNPGTRFVNALVYAAVGVLGALYAVSGGITIGYLSAFLAYANQYTRPFNDITAVLTQMQNAIASAQRIFRIIDWPEETPDQEDASTPENSSGHVEINDLFFSYDKSRPLIQDFNLNAKPGMRIALVGPTGCGKTTLINLLMRFYDIDSGEILVDGTPSQKIKRSSLRGLYGMVLQETWLKYGTVRENIAYAKPDATLEEITEAAKTALAHSFIRRLPQGYDTIVKDGGSNLSAGQRQLLCIARIMLAKPDMLILDEATSSIDTRTEIAIQRAMERLMQGHTSFIVAHRLSTILDADLIIVMKAGRIIEQGTHTQLLDKGGFYSNLFQSQFAQA